MNAVSFTQLVLEEIRELLIEPKAAAMQSFFQHPKGNATRNALPSSAIYGNQHGALHQGCDIKS